MKTLTEEMDHVLETSEKSGAQIVKKSKVGTGYGLFVIIIAFFGYAFSAMDANLFGIALPAVAQSLHITGSQAEYILSIGMALSVVAGLFIGPLADRLGRRKMFQGVLLFTGIFSALTAVVTNFIQLAIVRSLDTIGLDNIGPSNTLVSEMAPPRFRGLFLGIMQAGYPIGMAIAATIATFYLPGHWRTLFLIAFIPALVVVLVAFWIREPQEFMAAKAIRNPAATERRKFEWAQLFEAGIRKQTIVLLFYTFLINGGIAAQGAYFALYLTSHNQLGEVQAAELIGITGWIAVVSQISIGFIADRVSSKHLLVLLPLLASIGIFMMMGHGGFGSLLVDMTIYAVFGNGIYGCLTKYMSESFPVRMRGTAITGLIAIGNLNFVLIPLLGGVLLTIGAAQWTLFIVGAMLVIAGILMIAGRHIRPGQELLAVAGE